jgi:hypothetical protein
MSEPSARHKSSRDEGRAALDIPSIDATFKGGKTMCCVFTILLLLGPRFGILFWWLVNPARFNLAFDTWIWPLLGAIFLPWTTLMYLVVFPAGIMGWDWLWLGLGLLSDIAWWAGGGFRKRVPGYTGTY